MRLPSYLFLYLALFEEIIQRKSINIHVTAFLRLSFLNEKGDSRTVPQVVLLYTNLLNYLSEQLFLSLLTAWMKSPRTSSLDFKNFNVSIVTGICWQLRAGFICISPLTDDAGRVYVLIALLFVVFRASIWTIVSVFTWAVQYSKFLGYVNIHRFIVCVLQICASSLQKCKFPFFLFMDWLLGILYKVCLPS